MLEWLNWPAPDNVNACYTVRVGGNSCAPYNSFNLATHVGDDPSAVALERLRLATHLTLPPSAFCWLEQVHGLALIDAAPMVAQGNNIPPVADACFSRETGVVCTVMTADCLPVFFCDENGGQVAIAHAGWRGLLQGILHVTLTGFAKPASVLAYLGPAISQAAFEVGDDVRQQFIERYPVTVGCFIAGDKPNKWYGDLYGIARHLLYAEGVRHIYGGERCTFQEVDTFYSYRREGTTGRMAHLIWLT